MLKRFQLTICLTILLPLLGCGGNGLVNISGQISLGDVPLQQGEIRFIPAEGSKAPSAAAVITDGQYKVDVAPGSKRVEILGYKVIGQRDIGTVIDIKKQIIPERYNTQSQLTCTIVGGGETHDFELQQK